MRDAVAFDDRGVVKVHRCRAEVFEPADDRGAEERTESQARLLTGLALVADTTSLTPMEQAVVRLAVEGLSNPDIGSRLFMSRSTVKTHLSHVYAKLGVGNRTELAAMAGPHPTNER